MFTYAFYLSEHRIEKPIYGLRYVANDYGQGFYCTEQLELANFLPDYRHRDVIIGYQADDNHFAFAQDFISGGISLRQLGNAMRLGKLGLQFVAKSEHAFERFLASTYASRLERGDSRVVVGMSGIELARRAVAQTGTVVQALPSPSENPARSQEYWCGRAFAYHQWRTGFTFREIDEFAPIELVFDLYHPYHEMDITQLVDRLSALRAERVPETELKRCRVGSQAGPPLAFRTLKSETQSSYKTCSQSTWANVIDGGPATRRIQF